MRIGYTITFYNTIQVLEGIGPIFYNKRIGIAICILIPYYTYCIVNTSYTWDAVHEISILLYLYSTVLTQYEAIQTLSYQCAYCVANKCNEKAILKVSNFFS